MLVAIFYLLFILSNAVLFDMIYCQGSLTGLIPAMYLDLHGNEVECPDESAGLYIKSRNGDLKHVQLPINSIAFQIGETAQIHTGGILQATPHAVRGCSGIGGKSSVVSRESFAVFMEPE